MNLETDIRTAIDEICNEKTARRTVPAHALFIEIIGRVRAPTEDIKSCINRMITAGQLEWGRTINDHYFRNNT